MTLVEKKEDRQLVMRFTKKQYILVGGSLGIILAVAVIVGVTVGVVVGRRKTETIEQRVLNILEGNPLIDG